jgi:hypothetical protein
MENGRWKMEEGAAGSEWKREVGRRKQRLYSCAGVWQTGTRPRFLENSVGVGGANAA